MIESYILNAIFKKSYFINYFRKFLLILTFHYFVIESFDQCSELLTVCSLNIILNLLTTCFFFI